MERPAEMKMSSMDDASTLMSLAVGATPSQDVCLDRKRIWRSELPLDFVTPRAIRSYNPALPAV